MIHVDHLDALREDGSPERAPAAETAAGLVRYLRSGTPQMWDKAKGTR